MNRNLTAPETLKAVLPTKEIANGKNHSGKKELISYRTLLTVLPNGEIKELAEIRCWMGRSSSASTVYASVWVHSPEFWISGTGRAGGYGYHKESAAVAEALDSAGIKLFGSAYHGRQEVDMEKEAYIHGVGDAAIDLALLAIGAALGYKEFYIIKRG